MAMRNWVDDDDGEHGAPSMPPGLAEDEVGGTYTTVSQHATEQSNRQRRPVNAAP